MGFKNTSLDVRTGNGIDDTLLEGLYYTAKDGTQYCAPIGATTDGLSVPRCCQNIIPATGGDWFSGVLHDAAYRDQLQKLDVETQQWVKASLTQEQADGLIDEAMESQGVNIFEREIIYRALRLFGHAAFAADRAKNAPCG